MTHSLSKLAMAAATASLGAALVTGCGNDVPAGSVAKVGDETITKQEFNKWLKTAAAGQSQGGGSTAVPDPPDYTKCVDAKQQAALAKAQVEAYGGAAQEAVQAGVRPAQGRGHAVPDPVGVGPAGGRRT